MVKQLYYEDVDEGEEVPALVKHPTTRQLVKFAGASGDYYEIHYDKDYAQALGLPGVIVHGWLICSFLGQMITDWIGESGTLVKIGCSYRKMHFPGEDITCKGKVTEKYIKEGRHYVGAEIWTENIKGERAVLGSAVVILPSRGT